jgi:THO complex subunit 2
VCLESKDFVQIRNSLIVLTKIIHHFPAIQNLATVIEKRIEKVNILIGNEIDNDSHFTQVCEDEKDKRQDLYIKARSYQGQLGARKSKMMKESDFHVVRLVLIQRHFLNELLTKVKGKKGEESEAASSPAKKEKEKGGEGVEEGEIRSSGKEKRRDGDRRDRERSSASKERNRDSDSKERNSREKDVRDSRERDSHSRDRNGQGDMGPPATSRSTPRRSVDPDAGDRDPKRRRGEDKEREKEKSPVLDR